MRYLTSSVLAAGLLAGALALGAAPREAAAQSCSKPKKGCVVKKDLEKNAVDSSRVKNDSLKGKDIRDGTLTGGDFATGGLTGADFSDGSLTGEDIEDGSIGAAALAPGIDRDTAADLACGEDQIARFVDGAWDCVTGGASYVFLTSETHDGAFTVSGWDGLCQMDAQLAGLPAGSYRAWLSTSVRDARDLLPPGPFFRPDGLLVALSKADLFDERIMQDLNLFADGTAPAGGSTVSVWTGSTSTGTRLEGETCSDWASTGGQGERGNRTSDDSGWTTGGNASCPTALYAYCFQVD